MFANIKTRVIFAYQLNETNMKKAKLGDYLMWRGRLAKIVGEALQPTVIIETLEHSRCPHCDGDLGKKQEHQIVTSPLFQENAEPIKSITNNNHE